MLTRFADAYAALEGDDLTKWSSRFKLPIEKFVPQILRRDIDQNVQKFWANRAANLFHDQIKHFTGQIISQLRKLV